MQSQPTMKREPSVAAAWGVRGPTVAAPGPGYATVLRGWMALREQQPPHDDTLTRLTTRGSASWMYPTTTMTPDNICRLRQQVPALSERIDPARLKKPQQRSRGGWYRGGVPHGNGHWQWWRGSGCELEVDEWREAIELVTSIPRRCAWPQTTSRGVYERGATSLLPVIVQVPPFHLPVLLLAAQSNVVVLRGE